MLRIIPNVKKLEIKDGFLTTRAVNYNGCAVDSRIDAAAKNCRWIPMAQCWKSL